MKTSSSYLHLILVAGLLLSCKETPSSPELPLPEQGVDSVEPLIQMIDYYQVRFTDNNAVMRASDDLDHVGIGFVEDSIYTEQILLVPTVTKLGVSYAVSFDTVLTIPDSVLAVTTRARFYLSSGTSLDIDTTILCYHFPYESAEIVVAPSEMGYNGAVAQDMAFCNDIMYVLHVGDSRLFRRLPGETSLQFYFTMQESDFLAGDSCYIFIDNGINLERFNTTIDTFDLRLRSIPPNALGGIAAENGRVYVLYPYPSPYVVILDREGAVVDSMNIPTIVFHATISQDVLYGNDYANHTIALFDVKTRSALPSLRAPAWNIEGMEYHQGYLYYGDYPRRAILRIPLQHLKP